MPDSAPEYVLGADDNERRRLELQHRLWSPEAVNIWRRAGLKPGDTVLDLGCGPGFATLDLASLVGQEGRVVAVDEAERFITYLRAAVDVHTIENVEVRQSDALSLELPPDSIDMAYARWVFTFLSEPESVVQRIARALKPGGALAIQDYFNYDAIALRPDSPAFRRVIEATGVGWRAAGGDPDIGGRLPELMISAGLEVREVTPILRCARPGTLLWQWPETFFKSFARRLVSMGVLEESERLAFEAEWDERARLPHTIFTNPPVLDIIGVKRP